MISGLFSLPMPHADTLRNDDSARESQFVVGPENSLVRTLVTAVAAEALPYNPIVLCGPTGVGKSTLAHLLAEERRQVLGLANVVLTTTSDWARALAHAADTNSIADLRTRHQRCDLLLIDDIQRLVGKAAAQEYLTTTLDVLLRRGVLVLATLRHLPSATTGISPMLASRLSGGLIVPLVPPEALARRELVRQLAAQVDLELSDDLVSRVAEAAGRRKSTATMPQLRHAVLQIASSVKHQHERLRPSLVSQVMQADDPGTKAIVRQIVAAVGKQFQLSATELKGKSRQQAIAEARAVAMCLCRRLTDASYAEIGRHFGDRDHTTVLHACRKIENLVTQNVNQARLLEELATQIITDDARV